MQEKRHDCVVEMWLCFFSRKAGDYKMLFVATRKCRSTVRDLCPEAKIGSSLYVLENRRENLQDMVQAWLEQNFPENHS